MKITLKLEYACRILCELARHYDRGAPLSIDELSRTEDVPANFLAQILGELKNGKLVVSRRGAQGGFLLSREPSQITLYDIVQVTEGDLLELSGNHGGKSGRQLKQIWNEVRAAAAGRAKDCTLEQMAHVAQPVSYEI